MISLRKSYVIIHILKRYLKESKVFIWKKQYKKESISITTV